MAARIEHLVTSGTFSLLLTGGDDVVTLSNDFLTDGTTPAILIQGTSGGVAFENARVINSAIVIDTTLVDGNDTITITSAGSVPAQLVSRHWVITDANNKVTEVKGLGVVGQKPLLKPGESFEYTSGTNLETPVGTMRGTYQMVAEDGQHFDAAIPSFTLSVPRVLH